MGNFFQSAPITASRRGKNLKELLHHTEVPVEPSWHFPLWPISLVVLNTSSISGPEGTFHIRESFQCTSTNVVYGIVCNKCSMLYIGETKRRLADRFREHLRAIRIHDGTSEVGLHFSSGGHNIDDAVVTALKQFRSDLPRKTFETFLIRKLGTVD